MKLLYSSIRSFSCYYINNLSYTLTNKHTEIVLFIFLPVLKTMLNELGYFIFFYGSTNFFLPCKAWSAYKHFYSVCWNVIERFLFGSKNGAWNLSSSFVSWHLWLISSLETCQVIQAKILWKLDVAKAENGSEKWGEKIWLKKKKYERA